MNSFNAVLIGGESLLIACGEALLDRGHKIRAVVSRDATIRDWAEGKGFAVHDKAADLMGAVAPGEADWIFSIANLSLVPDDVLALAGQGAVNFHDGPLPDYAGLNTPAWALLNGRAQHGITWHRIEGGVDEGNILETRRFDIAEDDTAFSLNSKCYAAALDSFSSVLDRIEQGDVAGTPQSFETRQYFARADKPEGAGFLDLTRPASEIATTLRGLDFGGYWNPLTAPKLMLGGEIVIANHAAPATGTGAPGTVLSNDGTILTVATGDGALAFSAITDLFGGDAPLARLAKPGDVISRPNPAVIALHDEALSQSVKGEAAWRRALAGFAPVVLPLAGKPADAPDWRKSQLGVPAALTEAQAMAALALVARQSCDDEGRDIALAVEAESALVNPWVPVSLPEAATVEAFIAEFSTALDTVERRGPFLRELVARDPALSAPTRPDIAITYGDAPLAGTALTVSVEGTTATIWTDANRVSPAAEALLVERLTTAFGRVAEPWLALSEALGLPAAEEAALLSDWNATRTSFDPDMTLHGGFEAQVAATPDATAIVFEDQSLTYAELNARANALAAELIAKGALPGGRIGLYVERSLDLMIGALAILKSGAAYVPLDPAYPADRIAHYMSDSGASLVVTQGALASSLPATSATIVEVDTPRALVDENPATGVTGTDLAYLIYTSGSTGLPKGVMVEHRNVSNFFTGMDAIVDTGRGAVWMAVTSLSFDISVLELFYTLARGFKVVISGGETRAAVSSGKVVASDRPLDFSLMYWGNDDGQGPKKYELLLEGAKFADANGFTAVWTPERHFHAFGGPYPNPSVTGAAVAAVTKNISVRAGSCVAPLHHPARIAEEWAVVDNLTNGRAAIGVASGWHPDDFVLRPENTPPRNKPAMYEAIEQLRQLWRGEAVAFPTKDGGTFDVVTQPRPVSKELDVWVTTAGNPETWREAGEKGCNVLTHLLGQSVDEVAEKIKIYHAALQAAGHDPADFKVTLMLHTFLADTREESRRIAREPMKDYLRSAAALIKQYAWAFPAFKRPKGVENAFDLDLQSLEADEVEAILDFAFERYFEDSGLFGTVEDGVARCEQIKRIGVDEVACLIDYGIPSATVMEGLTPLAEVLKQANAPVELEPDDFSLAAQIIRHDVTHLQCTPSMARIIAMDDAARASLGHLHQVFLGGEALPGGLVADLMGATRAEVHNMYGPTETTIWSTHLAVTELPEGVVGIGDAIANTQVYVLGEGDRLMPVGLPGELVIGGAGVTRGYWQREELTAERFPKNPFGEGRLYRTGDLVRWTAEGKLDFLGRTDHQVKIRGQRIELGEIETRMEGFANITAAVAIAREMAPGDLRLVGYYTASGMVSTDALRADLAEHLPEVMVPAHFVRLESFPLTPNRKIDRKALPAPVLGGAAPQTASVSAPATGAAAKVAAIWSRTLGVERVGPGDNFFALGGHSLLAVQVHREIKQELGVASLSITDIFRFPVLGDLVAHIDPGTGAGPEPEPEEEGDKSETMSKRRAMRARRKVGA